MEAVALMGEASVVDLPYWVVDYKNWLQVCFQFCLHLKIVKQKICSNEVGS